MSPQSDELDAAKRHNRVWCRECRKFRPWANMDMALEKRKDGWHRLWLCTACGQVCRDDALTLAVRELTFDLTQPIIGCILRGATLEQIREEYGWQP